MVPSLANAQSNVWSTRVKMLHPDINLTVLLPRKRTPPPAFPHDLAKFHVPLMSKRHANSCVSVNKRFGSGRASPCPRPPGSDCLLPPGRSWKTPPVLLLPLLPPHTQSSPHVRLKCSQQQQQIPEPSLKMPMKLAYWDIRGVRRTVRLTFHSLQVQHSVAYKVISVQSSDGVWRLLVLKNKPKCNSKICIRTSRRLLLLLRNTGVHVLRARAVQLALTC